MQQSGGAIVMDFDATTTLHHKGIAPTDDKFKFTWFEKVASLKNRVDSAPIPTAQKADIRAKIALLQIQVRKAQKKIAEENLQKAIELTTKIAEKAKSEGKPFCISCVNVGLDPADVREGVIKVTGQKEISAMVFSTDETTNKAVVCVGVPEKGSKSNQLEVSEWLMAALEPIKGRCEKGKGGLATGQMMRLLLFASSFASMKLN